MRRDNKQTPGCDFCDVTRQSNDIQGHYVNTIRDFDERNEELYIKRTLPTSVNYETECEQHCK